MGYFILGGQFETDRQLDDLKQLYRIYLTEAFGGGRLEDKKVQNSALNYIKPSNYVLPGCHSLSIWYLSLQMLSCEVYTIRFTGDLRRA